MKYTKLGLVNTNDMFRDAMEQKYAVPAFNFYNMETFQAIMDAARTTHSPVILAVSEAALKYMSPEMLTAMMRAANISPDDKIALHLDHGSTFEACAHAIKIGFSSVMIDASKLPFDQNVALSRRVAEFAHKHDVSVESELGVLSGIEDENTQSKISTYTNPADVEKFVTATGTDSLAIAIGTSHGAYKRPTDDTELRFDILADVAKRMPDLPLVLHGASNIPQKQITTINKFGGKISGARGIDVAQLRRATKMNVCKINVDSDLRLGFTAAVRKSLYEKPENFNPREFLSPARDTMTQICIDEIRNIMGSEDKI